MVKKDIRIERELRESKLLLKIRSRNSNTAGSFLQRWNVRLSPDLLNQEVQLQKVPTCFVGTLDFEKPWSRTVALRPGCILELPNVTCERALSRTNKISGAQALFLLLLLLFLFCLFI